MNLPSRDQTSARIIAVSSKKLRRVPTAIDGVGVGVFASVVAPPTVVDGVGVSVFASIVTPPTASPIPTVAPPISTTRREMRRWDDRSDRGLIDGTVWLGGVIVVGGCASWVGGMSCSERTGGGWLGGVIVLCM